MSLRDAIQAALDKHHPNNGDRCFCDHCKVIVAQAGNLTCETCGYCGPFMPYACCCYDYLCRPRARGAGCVHGSLGCPVCLEGEGDITGWDMVKRVRAALAKNALDELLQEGQELGLDKE